MLETVEINMNHNHQQTKLFLNIFNKIILIKTLDELQIEFIEMHIAYDPYK